MINYIKRKLEKLKQKKTFLEYGYEIKTFKIDGIGAVDYAQWLHPFEQPKVITNSNVNFYKRLAKPGAMVIDITSTVMAAQAKFPCQCTCTILFTLYTF